MSKFNEEKPPLRLKILFWFIVGSISTFFAEVVCGSTPFPFFTPDGWLIVYPIYALHIFVLGCIVIKYGKPTLYSLYSAGIIFGMYETYITKVIWGSAEWTSGPSIFGIYLIPFFLVALFWHPFMSFIIPLSFSEISLTSSLSIPYHMPNWIVKLFTQKQRRNLATGAVILGLLGVSSHSPTTVFLSTTLNVGFIAILIFLWRRFTSGTRYSLRDYIPGKIGFSIGLSLLLLFYIIFGAIFNPQYMPSIPVHIFTLLIYAFLFYLLWRSIVMSKSAKKRVIPKISLPRKFIFLLILLFITTATFISLFPLKIFITAAFLIIEGAIGIIFFVCLIIVVLGFKSKIAERLII